MDEGLNPTPEKRKDALAKTRKMPNRLHSDGATERVGLVRHSNAATPLCADRGANYFFFAPCKASRIRPSLAVNGDITQFF